MKAIYTNRYQTDLFEVAKIIKEKIPDKKVFIHKTSERIIIKISRESDTLKIEEIKTLLKIKFPKHLLSFQYID